MNRYNKSYLLILLLLIYGPFVVLLASCKSSDDPKPIEKPGGDDDGDEDSPAGDFNYVYKEETGGYQVYRIPALVKTVGGKLLAFAEARKLKSNGDSGDIDLVVKVSDDNGKTWGNSITIWDDGPNTCGNPVPIVDQETGRIHLLMSWNDGEDTWGAISDGKGKAGRKVFYTWSDDEGTSWQTPKEITSDVKDATWNWYGTGPVHGIQISKGNHKGRLVSPNYFNVNINGQRKDYAHVIYSDDHGQTWKPGAATPSDNVGECTVAELSDGRLMLNMRPSVGNARIYSISEDGGETWEAMQTDYTLVDANCQGSMCSGTIGGQYGLFFANAASAERKNMTVKRSKNDGTSWTQQLQIHEGPSGYSDMTITEDNQLALLYESGVGRPYEGIALKLMALDDLK